MEVTRLHTFDLYDKLSKMTVKEVLSLPQGPTHVDIDGVRYMEDVTLPFDVEAAKRNGLPV